MILQLTLYIKSDCALCEPFKNVIQTVIASKLFQKTIVLEIIDIEKDPVAHERYHDKIPVLEINGRLAFKYQISERELKMKLTRLFATRHT